MPRQWFGDAGYASGLVESCHAARDVAIGKLSAGQLRMLLGQRIGVRFVLELALEVVEREPFVSASYYPGDLLTELARLPVAAWDEHPECRGRFALVARRAIDQLDVIENPGERRRLERSLLLFATT